MYVHKIVCKDRSALTAHATGVVTAHSRPELGRRSEPVFASLLARWPDAAIFTHTSEVDEPSEGSAAARTR